ncbi:MAG: cell division protein FtsL [Legionellales bacterium RIFCSPHIGHO2_12_FULL_37_14]|nr:MAG: cell division protein FtsL [Legionellales bacterium RIFCSPHIGHO2_12_FULL_37_14]
MNAAARMIHQSNVFTGHWLSLRISKIQSMVMVLATCLLLNAIAVIYVANASRSSMSELEHLYTESHELHIEWGRLLLEQAALSSPARVEKVANEELNMHMPSKQAQALIRI